MWMIEICWTLVMGIFVAFRILQFLVLIYFNDSDG